MRVREPVEAPRIELHGASILKAGCILIARYALVPGFTGVQGPWERQKLEALPQPRTSLERTYAFLGHPSWPKAASRRAMRIV